jgi:hypothetical protein
MNAYVINLDSRPDRLKSFRKNGFPFEVKRYPGVVASCGEDGCTYSHLNILREQKEFPFVVFEDDCVLLHPWSVVEEAMKQLPINWDGLWVGTNPRRRLERYSPNLFKINGSYSSHAIIYGSKRIVNYILKNHNTPTGQNLDIFYCHQLMKVFNCFVVYPLVATQLSDYSDIAHVNTNNRQVLIDNYNRFTK